ncbi:MAG: cyclic nucleotide-binding/CBS domain-containing protein [Candidatus Heimdallarchaeota archaeon]
MVTTMIVRVRDLMNENIISVDVSASILDAIQIMTANEIGSIVVTRGGDPVGILTERDCLKKVCGELDCAIVTAGEIMSTPLITIDADASLYKAARMMLENNIRRLFVIRDGTIVGIFTQKDLLTKINDVFLALASI